MNSSGMGDGGSGIGGHGVFDPRSRIPDPGSGVRSGCLALLVLFVLFASTLDAVAQAPVVNAKIERRVAPAAIAKEVQTIADQGAAAWVGYRVPMVRRATASLRTSDTCCGRCRLEPPTDLVVLARVEGRRLVELRPVSVDCDIDAAGMTLVWFDGVNPDDSIRWLESLAVDASGRTTTRIADAALTALGQHASPAAAPVRSRSS
jgi:hypothetical protein